MGRELYSKITHLKLVGHGERYIADDKLAYLIEKWDNHLIDSEDIYQMATLPTMNVEDDVSLTGTVREAHDLLSGHSTGIYEGYLQRSAVICHQHVDLNYQSLQILSQKSVYPFDGKSKKTKHGIEKCTMTNSLPEKGYNIVYFSPGHGYYFSYDSKDQKYTPPVIKKLLDRGITKGTYMVAIKLVMIQDVSHMIMWLPHINRLIALPADNSNIGIESFTTCQNPESDLESINELLIMHSFPLKFSDAISSHAAQGATIERIHLDLHSKFMLSSGNGSLLVPLSRARSWNKISVQRNLPVSEITKHCKSLGYMRIPEEYRCFLPIIDHLRTSSELMHICKKSNGILPITKRSHESIRHQLLNKASEKKWSLIKKFCQ